MADAIERIMENGDPVDCFAYQGDAAWHNKGQRLGASGDRSIGVRDIEAAARANWQVTKEGLITETSGKILKGHKALVRDRDNRLLGLCSAQYKIHQHTVALGDILQVLVDMKRGAWETVGVLNDGVRVFYTVRLDQRLSPVKNDDIELFAVGTTQHDGSGASDWILSGTRVVCANTLAVAMAHNIRAVHIGDTADKLDKARQAILGVSEDVEQMQTGMKQLGDIVLNEQAAQRFLDKVTPVKALPPPDVMMRMDDEKQKDILYKQDLAMRVQMRIKELHEVAPGQEMAVRGTGYAWLNAVTNYATHEMKSNSKLESVMVGDASKMGRRAYQVLTSESQLEEVLNG